MRTLKEFLNEDYGRINEASGSDVDTLNKAIELLRKKNYKLGKNSYELICELIFNVIESRYGSKSSNLIKKITTNPFTFSELGINTTDGFWASMTSYVAKRTKWSFAQSQDKYSTITVTYHFPIDKELAAYMED